MNVLVTGAAGSLGREVVRQLQARRHALVLMGRSEERLASTFPETSGRFVQTDYTVDRLTPELKSVDAVVHLAGKRLSKGEARLADYECNISTTENLLEAADRQGVKRFVFASTYSIYSSGLNALPFREDQCVAPRNAYAISKLASEHVGGMHNLDFVALRFSQLVGPYERAGYLLMTFILNALQNKQLRIFGRGRGRRDYLYVKDAAWSIVKAVECDGVRGVFNIGSAETTSHQELASLAADVFSDRQADVVSVSTPQEDSAVLQVDRSKAALQLQWEPRFSLEDAFRDMNAEHRLTLLERAMMMENASP